MRPTVASGAPASPSCVAARALLIACAAAFVVLWAVMWLPVLLAGSEGTLLLYPIVFLLALGAWGGAWTALALAARAVQDGGGRRSAVVVAMSAILLAVGPVLLWFGPVVG